jgi:L-asparaginase II
MLVRARLSNWSTEGYELATHPVQTSIIRAVEMWTDVAERDMTFAVDGCGVVVFGLPLVAMARAYARLVRAAARGESAPKRVVDAMLTYPFLLGGTDRFDTVMMEESNGTVLCKVGAEGIHCAAVPSMGAAVAIKVEDGAVRAQYPALLTLLQQLGALPDPLPPKLAELARKPVRNSRHEMVGEVIPYALAGLELGALK